MLRDKIEKLLDAHDTHVKRGSLKASNSMLSEIIRTLLDHIDTRIEVSKEDEHKIIKVDAGDLPPKEAIEQLERIKETFKADPKIEETLPEFLKPVPGAPVDGDVSETEGTVVESVEETKKNVARTSPKK